MILRLRVFGPRKRAEEGMVSQTWGENYWRDLDFMLGSGSSEEVKDCSEEHFHEDSQLLNLGDICGGWSLLSLISVRQLRIPHRDKSPSLPVGAVDLIKRC